MSNTTFIPGANQYTCNITRDEKEVIEFSPAEVDSATNLVGTALSMESMKALPDRITGSPFVIRFFPDDSLRLERNDKGGSIPFNWAEGDTLIIALQQAQAIAIDERRLQGLPRGVL